MDLKLCLKQGQAWQYPPTAGKAWTLLQGRHIKIGEKMMHAMPRHLCSASPRLIRLSNKQACQGQVGRCAGTLRPYKRSMLLRTAQSPTGRMSGRPSTNMENMSTL